MGNETKYTLDNIQEFFDSLDNAPNSKIRKMMVWAGYERDRLLREELRNIEKIYESKDDNPIYHYNAHKISDKIMVKTVWANMSYDNHKTIDKSKYIQEIA